MSIRINPLSYPGYSDNKSGLIIYTVHSDGKVVYFSGITNPEQSTSTVNAAEQIIAAICSKEGLDWEGVSFYDIQTHLGYYKDPGEIEAYLLITKAADGSQISVTDWQSIDLSEIPDQVLKIFRNFIEGLLS